MQSTVKPVSEGLFKYVNEKASLIISECDICQHTAFPKQNFCPECGKESMAEVSLQSGGVLKSISEICAPPPGYSGPVPYKVGIVEFSEKNIRILGVISDQDTADIKAGTKMEIVIEPSYEEEGVTYLTYKFRPSE